MFGITCLFVFVLLWAVPPYLVFLALWIGRAAAPADSNLQGVFIVSSKPKIPLFVLHGAMHCAGGSGCG